MAASLFHDSPRSFRDRHDAGRRLAAYLGAYQGRPDVLVLAIPRGGVPVAYEVARALRARLDVILVRKLGLPAQPELAMGAIASGGVRVLNQEVVGSLQIPDSVIESVAARERAELERREHAYRAGRAALDLAGQTVILVDDGLATGSSMRAAITAARERKAASVVVAVPVAPPSTCRALAHLADELVCPKQPQIFAALSEWYDDFTQTSDDEVRQLLEDALGFTNPGPDAGTPAG
jgi:putative phosphoribosyl transferase